MISFKIKYQKLNSGISETTGSLKFLEFTHLPEPLRQMWDKVLSNVSAVAIKDCTIFLVSNIPATSESWLTEITCGSEEVVQGTMGELSPYLKIQKEPEIDFPDLGIVKEYIPTKMFKEEKKGKKPYYNKNRPF